MKTLKNAEDIDREEECSRDAEEQNEDLINDDLEDNYEDQTPFDVRDEKDGFEEEGKEEVV